jgi:hypothetical protein
MSSVKTELGSQHQSQYESLGIHGGATPDYQGQGILTTFCMMVLLGGHTSSGALYYTKYDGAK